MDIFESIKLENYFLHVFGWRFYTRTNRNTVEIRIWDSFRMVFVNVFLIGLLVFFNYVMISEGRQDLINSPKITNTIVIVSLMASITEFVSMFSLTFVMIFYRQEVVKIISDLHKVDLILGEYCNVAEVNRTYKKYSTRFCIFIGVCMFFVTIFQFTLVKTMPLLATIIIEFISYNLLGLLTLINLRIKCLSRLAKLSSKEHSAAFSCHLFKSLRKLRKIVRDLENVFKIPFIVLTVRILNTTITYTYAAFYIVFENAMTEFKRLLIIATILLIPLLSCFCLVILLCDLICRNYNKILDVFNYYDGAAISSRSKICEFFLHDRNGGNFISCSLFDINLNLMFSVIITFTVFSVGNLQHILTLCVVGCSNH